MFTGVRHFTANVAEYHCGAHEWRKFIYSVFIYFRNINLKIYKNEKIVNCKKTDQILAENNNNNNNNK